MTSLGIKNFACWVCSTKYTGAIVHSYNSHLGRPDIEPVLCPYCEAAPRSNLEPSVAGFRCLLEILAYKNNSAQFKYELDRKCAAKKDAQAWYDFLLSECPSSEFPEISVKISDDIPEELFNEINSFNFALRVEQLQNGTKSDELTNQIDVDEYRKATDKALSSLAAQHPFLKPPIEKELKKRGAAISQLTEKSSINNAIRDFLNDDERKISLKHIFDEVGEQIEQKRAMHLAIIEDRHREEFIRRGGDPSFIE